MGGRSLLLLNRLGRFLSNCCSLPVEMSQIVAPVLVRELPIPNPQPDSARDSEAADPAVRNLRRESSLAMDVLGARWWWGTAFGRIGDCEAGGCGARPQLRCGRVPGAIVM